MSKSLEMYPRAATYHYPVEALDRARCVSEFLHIIGVPLYAQNFYYEDIGLAEFQSMNWRTLYLVRYSEKLCRFPAACLISFNQFRSWASYHNTAM